jgi:WD40 repeat protein
MWCARACALLHTHTLTHSHTHRPPLLASGSLDGTCRIWNVATNIQIAVCEHEVCAFLSRILDCKLMLTHTLTHIHMHTYIHTPQAGCVRVAWHPSKPILYTCSLDGVVRVFEGRNGKLLFQGVGHQSHVLDFAIADKGNTIVSCGEDAKVLVFSVGHLLP